MRLIRLPNYEPHPRPRKLLNQFQILTAADEVRCRLGILELRILLSLVLKQSNLTEYAKLLQLVNRNSLLRRENNDRLVEKIVNAK